jgi:hypothetical protein
MWDDGPTEKNESWEITVLNEATDQEEGIST